MVGAVRRIFEPAIVANMAASTLAQCLTALAADRRAALSIRYLAPDRFREFDG